MAVIIYEMHIVWRKLLIMDNLHTLKMLTISILQLIKLISNKSLC